MSENTHEVEPGRIEMIRRLPLKAYQQAELILVAADQKPATVVSCPLREGGDPRALIDQLRTAGFNAELVSSDTKEGLIAVSLKPEAVEALRTIRPDRDHDLFGSLMGFPQSAREAFVNKSSQSTHEEQERLLANAPLFHFRLSQAGATQEAALIAQWNETIRRYAPDLFTQIEMEEKNDRYESLGSSMWRFE